MGIFFAASPSRKVGIGPVSRGAFILNEVVLGLIKGGSFREFLKALKAEVQRREIVQEQLVMSRLFSEVPKLEVLPLPMPRAELRGGKRKKAGRVPHKIVGLREP